MDVIIQFFVIDQMKTQSEKLEKKELIRVYIEINKNRLQIKFPFDTRVLCLEEYLKRTTKMGPTEAVFLFVKEQRKIMTPEKTIAEYAKLPTKEEMSWDNPHG
jgi:hypothetical protein